MSKEELEVICDLVRDLTEIRAKYCNHLAVENFSTELFKTLLITYYNVTHPMLKVEKSGVDVEELMRK